MRVHEIVILFVISKKQKTLKLFGFTKVVQRGIEIEVAIDDEVQDAEECLCPEVLLFPN